jgi:2-polyprenyl-3-methyl-5-hydroxy-6-metoxy-1,4-benzoquinol methylase
MGLLQDKGELEDFYSSSDPWSYDTTTDDHARIEMLISELPKRPFERVLDIGCGNGFLTSQLPGKEIVGIDVSEKALGWARKRCQESRYSFYRTGIFELSADKLGTFDLIVVTGVLYPQYIGHALELARIKINEVLRPSGMLVHAHIFGWFKGGFRYDNISTHVYKYREYHHLLETYQK